MEPFYGFKREIDLRDAGSSIVAFEEWLELGEGERPAATHLDRIERYNRDDVVSNQRLRDWLEDLRHELRSLTGQPVPRPTPRVDELPADLTEAQARVQDLVDRLAGPEAVPVDATDRTQEEHARWLLAQLLGWHRREDKSMWWDFHRLMDLTPQQLVDESAPIGMLEPVGPIDEPKDGKQSWSYTFPAQDFDFAPGEAYDPGQKQLRPNDSPFSWNVGELTAIDPAAGTLVLKRSLDQPHPMALVPLPWFRTKEHQESLVTMGEWVATNGIGGAGPYRAARDLLLGVAPRVGQDSGTSLRRTGETDLEAARRLALVLDETTLAIQGPPGSGKTYAGARMILTLLRDGKRVGITGTSHKVIGNLIAAVLDAAEQARTPGDVRVVQRGKPDQVLDDPRVARGKDNPDVRAWLDSGRANLSAGTSWLWASSKMIDAVDVLFVDEAGQISLANVVAISRSTKSIVLLGDPQQLDQPLQGSHPPGAERSALAHVLDGEATMPPDRGLFLETTWRLHPELCSFTSEVFYDGRLAPEPHLVVQGLDAPGADLRGRVGPRLLGVPTVGADNESPDEADEIARLARSIVEGGASWVNEREQRRPVTWDEVLIVAPYNAQVGAIKRRLPSEARVGTVDKFQGQEAPISIYSMTTSNPELAPRGMDFLYSRHRLNVATSRARCVTIVAASPDLLRVRARTPEQMRLANALCRFAEVAIHLERGARPARRLRPSGWS
jgi:hypothetical protein